MFRRQVRRGIRAVQDGQPLATTLTPDAEGRVTTYCNDTIVHAPAAPTPEEDVKQMRQTGRRLAEEYIATRGNGHNTNGH